MRPMRAYVVHTLPGSVRCRFSSDWKVTMRAVRGRARTVCHVGSVIAPARRQSINSVKFANNCSSPGVCAMCSLLEVSRVVGRSLWVMEWGNGYLPLFRLLKYNGQQSVDLHQIKKDHLIIFCDHLLVNILITRILNQSII